MKKQGVITVSGTPEPTVQSIKMEKRFASAIEDLQAKNKRALSISVVATNFHDNIATILWEEI